MSDAAALARIVAAIVAPLASGFASGSAEGLAHRAWDLVRPRLGTQRGGDAAELAARLEKALLEDPALAERLAALLSRGQAPREAPGAATLPPPPALLVGREEDYRALLAHLAMPRALGVQTVVALRGLPGVGKTTLTASLAHREDAAAVFPDGILWASLGQDGEAGPHLRAWARALGVDPAGPDEEVSQRVSGALRRRRALLIVEDAWDSGAARGLLLGGASCAHLVTTREPRVALDVAAPDDVLTLDILSSEASVRLLAHLAPGVARSRPAEALALAEALERLPLALHVAGRLLHVEAARGFGIDGLLGGLKDAAALLGERAPPDRADPRTRLPPTVSALLRLSTDRLDAATRERFSYLGAFAGKPATFPLRAVADVWAPDPERTMRELVDRGLLEPVGPDRWWLHAVLVAHARELLEEG